MDTLKHHIIMFIVMLVVGILFNPMNMLAYSVEHLYFSTTLFYGGLLMASNMIWSHEIVKYLTTTHINKNVFVVGIIMTCFSVFLLRSQLFVSHKEWLRRMIPHHSTALTTTTKLLDNDKSISDNSKIFRLAKDILYNQDVEIRYMQTLI